MERRRFTRVPFKAPVTVISPRLRIKVETKNLSARGAYVTTTEAMEPGERLWLRLVRTEVSESPIMIPGKVVRRDEQGIGIEFGPMRLDTFLALKDVVASVSGDEGQLMAELFRFVEHESGNSGPFSSEFSPPSRQLETAPSPGDDGPNAA